MDVLKHERNHPRKRLARRLESSLLVFSSTDPLAMNSASPGFLVLFQTTYYKLWQLALYSSDTIYWTRLNRFEHKYPCSLTRFDNWTPWHSYLWVTKVKLGWSSQNKQKDYYKIHTTLVGVREDIAETAHHLYNRGQHQEGDNIRASNGSRFDWSFWHHRRQSIFCRRRWAEEPEQWTGNRRFIFSPPLVSHVSLSREMPRSPRLAHKAPVMQANMTISATILETWDEIWASYLRHARQANAFW